MKRTPSDAVALIVDGQTMTVPAGALDGLRDVLFALSDGSEVAVVPADIAVGTSELSRVLGMSTTWVTELIDRGDLASTRVGSKRRVLLRDLATYVREQRRGSV